MSATVSHLSHHLSAAHAHRPHPLKPSVTIPNLCFCGHGGHISFCPRWPPSHHRLHQSAANVAAFATGWDVFDSAAINGAAGATNDEVGLGGGGGSLTH